MQKLISEILKNIRNLPKHDDDKFFNRPISKNNFYSIDDVSSDKKLIFIDGGNQELLAAPNFSLQLIRTYYSVYLNNKRVNAKKNDFFILGYSADKIKSKIFQVKNAVAPDEKDIFFEDIAKIGELARRISELKVAKTLMDDLNNSIVVLDGCLDFSTEIEEKYINDLYKKASEKNNIICALSKTSRLLTQKGNSIIAALKNIAPANEWYYKAMQNKIYTYFVKLHKNSKYIFRFELFKNNNVNEILSLLAKNSVDPIFLGYPYGLIEADRFARISNNEKKYFKTIFMAKAGKEIRKYANAVDAHSILDNIA